MPATGSKAADDAVAEPAGDEPTAIDAAGPGRVPGQGGEPAAVAASPPAPAQVEPPAAHGEALELLAELAETAKSAAAALRGGDAAAALAAADAACERATRARRLLKPAVTGRKARSGEAARPGQLRDLVRGHLTAYPDAEFTPHAIGRVLGRSSGAVANALDKLTALGQAQLTSEHPRRYKATATEPSHSYLAA